MTATNMCSNFGGFGCSTPSLLIINWNMLIMLLLILCMVNNATVGTMYDSNATINTMYGRNLPIEMVFQFYVN